MSTSIRPGGPVAPGIAGAEATPETAATTQTDATSATKPGAVDQASGASGAQATQAAPAGSATATLLARLDAGEVTREQAIEGLVAEALEVHGGARLPAAQRSELESVLRAALQDDPTLGRLLG